MEHRFSLEKGSKKHQCPGCGMQKRFVRYVDNNSGEYLNSQVGRCERIFKCGYHWKPSDFFRDNPLAINEFRKVSDMLANPVCPTPITPDFISPTLVAKSLSHYGSNNFIIWMESLFGEKVAHELASQFKLGTSKRWKGSTVFWQLDKDMKIRSGKVMLYNPSTGNRVKRNGRSCIDWVHSILLRNGKLRSFQLQQCLFGEHQLVSVSTDKPAAIVESEKTAILMSAIYPSFVWLACGSATNIKSELFVPLFGRPIILYPDLNGHELWVAKGLELNQQGYQVKVSSLLEEFATENDRVKGLDLADYLIKTDETGLVITEAGYPLLWDI